MQSASAFAQRASAPIASQNLICNKIHKNPSFSAIVRSRPFGIALPNHTAHTLAGVRVATTNTDYTAAPAAPTSADNNSTAADSQNTTKLVDELLTIISDTDRGSEISDEKRQVADAIIDKLADIGEGSRPLTNDLIYGNYNVAYVSQGNKQDGQPAGGRFRTGIGRFLFRTTRLCQSVLSPDIVTNKVEVKLFGVLPCAIGLRGNLVSVPFVKDGPDNQDTVKVFFEPPMLSLAGGIHTRIGPPSSVVLKTSYLDERVRLGLGSRGSKFVFTRGGDSELAGMDQVGLQQTSVLGKALIFAFVAGLVVGGGYLAQSVQLSAPMRASGVIMMLLGAVIGGVFRRGGIINGDPASTERPEVVLKKE